MGNVTVWGWGVVLGHSKRYQPDIYFVDILIPSSMNSGAESSFPFPRPLCGDALDLQKAIDFSALSKAEKKRCGLSVVRFGTECISKVSSVRLRGLPSRIQSDSEHFGVWRKVLSAQEHFGGALPEVDPLNDANVLAQYKETDKIALKEDFEETLPKLEERMLKTAYFESKFKHKTDA